MIILMLWLSFVGLVQDIDSINIGNGNPNWRAIGNENCSIVFLENISKKQGKMGLGNFKIEIDKPYFRLTDCGNKTPLPFGASHLYPAGANQAFMRMLSSNGSRYLILFILSDQGLTSKVINSEEFGLTKNQYFLGVIEDNIYYYELEKNDIIYIKSPDGKVDSKKIERAKRLEGILKIDKMIYVEGTFKPKHWRIAPLAYDFEIIPL